MKDWHSGYFHQVKDYDLPDGINQIGDVTGGVWPEYHWLRSHQLVTSEDMRAVTILWGGDDEWIT